MTATDPKTIGETRARMQQIVRDFRAQAARASTARRGRLADRARRAIERLRKQFKHKIDDMQRQDAKQYFARIDGRGRLGLEEQLRLAVEGAMQRLEKAGEDLGRPHEKRD